MSKSQQFQNYNPAAFVITRFGGIRPLAKRIGKPVATVQGWLRSGEIPRPYLFDIMTAALKDHLDMLWSDFVVPRSLVQSRQAGRAPAASSKR